MAGDDIDSVELLVIEEKPMTERYRTGWKLRVVQWTRPSEGKSLGVFLERREFYEDADGNIQAGKAKGLSLKDLQACRPHWAEIIGFMKNPPLVKPPEPEPEQPVDSAGMEEIPF